MRPGLCSLAAACSRPSRDQLGQQLAVVDDFVVAAGLRIVVAQAVHAMRAVGHDPPHAASRERCDVLLGQLLEQQLVAHAAGRFAGAAFLGAEHGEVHVRRLQQSHDAAGDLLHAAIVRGRAADPVQNLEIGVLAGERHVEPGRPRQPIARAHAPGIAGAVGLLQRGGRRAAQRAFADQMPPHVGDHPHRADAQRADVGARAAGGARPQRFGGDRLAVHVRLDAACEFMHADQILHDVSRRERFAGLERRASVLAAAAGDAGVELDQLPAGEVGERARRRSGPSPRLLPATPASSRRASGREWRD